MSDDESVPRSDPEGTKEGARQVSTRSLEELEECGGPGHSGSGSGNGSCSDSGSGSDSDSGCRWQRSIFAPVTKVGGAACEVSKAIEVFSSTSPWSK